MSQIGTIVTAALSLYALVAAVFLVSENRRPQATLAWLLAFVFAPGIGVLLYWSDSSRRFPRWCLLMMVSAGAVQRKGFGSALWASR